MKRVLAKFMLMLASIAVFAHVVVPHHHHCSLLVPFVCSAPIQEYSHECSHQHNEHNSQDCSGDNVCGVVYFKPTQSEFTPLHSVSSPLQLLFDFRFDACDVCGTGLNTVCDIPEPYITPALSNPFLLSSGLRAPPAILCQ